MDSSENYNILIAKINVFIRKYYINNLLRGLIFLGAGLFSAYVVITISEYFGNFNSFFRGVLFYGFILLNLGLIGWLIIPSLLAWLKLGKTLTHDQAAEIIGKHFNDINDKLLNTLQLKKLSAGDIRHRELIEASIDQKIENLKPVRFPSAININENKKYLKWILGPLAVIVVIGLAAPSILTESTKKIIRHGEYFAPVAPFQFVVLNSGLSAVQGDDLKLELKLQGNRFPADVYVETANNTFKLDKENTSRFHYLFTNLQQNTSFRLVANGFESMPYEIKVNLRPSLLHFDAELSYPAYLHKKNETVANAGDMTIPAGTTVTWQFHTQNATGLSFSMDGHTQPLTPEGKDLFEHRERIINNTTYKLNPVNSLVNHTDSAAYRVNVIADELPSITVEEKPDSVSLNAFYFNGKIQDDHGFSALTFHYKIGTPGDKNSEHEFVKPVKADLSQTLADFFYFWNLKDLGINPGEQVTYFFEVADNDGVSGPKKARSAEHALNMPDAKALNAELNNETTVVRQKMESASKMAEEIDRESQKLNELLLNKNTLSFDEKKQVQELLQKRQELDDIVKQIQDLNKKNLYNRQENQSQSQQQNQQLTEEQKQIEQLLNNILDPKTREMLQRLQQMMQQDQKESTRSELSKMQTGDKSLKRELERMAALYKKLEFDQKLNQNLTQLTQLADKQQKLADETKPEQPQAQQDQQKQQQAKQDQQKQNQAAQQDQQKQNQQQGQQKQNQAAQQDQQKQNQQQGQQNQQGQQDQQKQSQQAQQSQPKDKEQLLEEQKKLNQAFQDIKKSLEDLKKSNDQSDNKQNFENPEKDENNIEDQMSQSSDQLSKNNRSKASQSQQQSAKSMRQLADKMQQQEEEGDEKQNEVDIKQLRELLKSLVNSSFDQEKVMETLKSTSMGDPKYVALGQNQKNIKDNLKTAEDSLYSLSKRVPQIQSTVNKEITTINTQIDAALESLGQRRTSEATRDQQYAMTSMNNLALMLSDALSQLQAKMNSSKSGKGKGKGKSKQMSASQLRQMQDRLNQNMQQARDQMQKEGNPGQSKPGQPRQGQGQGQMSEQLAKLARDQQMIRQQLQELNQEETQDGGSGIKNADKISQQMEQTEKDIVNRKITDDVIKRQEQIKIRLLEAEKAEQERDQDNKRESNVGKDVPPGYIKALQDYQQTKNKQTEQIRTVPPALNLYYKQKIKSYFDELNAN